MEIIKRAMENLNKYQVLLLIMMLFPSVAGCQSTRGNTGQMQSYPVNIVEAEWIRNGEPIEFEDKLWYPVDGIEGLLDSEVYLMGSYRGVQFFVDKIDVRPFERLYTKFGKDKFRYYKLRRVND